MKLNLASGTDIKDPPWVNLDIVAWPTARRPPDRYWDARKDKIPFDDGSADEVYAGYLLLHLAPNYHDDVMREIFRVLQPGGKLVVGEVDFRIVFPRWLENPDNIQLSELIWGEQGIRAHGVDYAAWDKHCWGWTEDKLRRYLVGHGFQAVCRIQIHHPDVFYELTLEATRP